MRKAASGIAGELARIALFEGLGPEALENLAGASSYLEVRSEERIYWQGEIPNACYQVISGHVRRTLASPEGDEKTIDVMSAGQGFGLVEMFGQAPYVSFAAATEKSLLLRIGREVIMEAMGANPMLSLRVMAAAADRQAAFERDVAACFFHSGCRRLIDYLIRQAGAAFDPEGETTFQLPITKRLIAARIGVSAETLSRSFRELSEAGLIRVCGREVTLLRKLAARRAADAVEVHQHAQRQVRDRRCGDRRTERSSFARPPGSRAWL